MSKSTRQLLRSSQLHASPWRTFLVETSGSELVEFALSAVVLLTTVFGIMDFSRALYADHYVAGVARDATRYAMVRGSTWSGTPCSTPTTYNCAATAGNVTQFVLQDTPLGFQASNLTVQTSWPGTTSTGLVCDSTAGANSPGCLVNVTVSYSFNFVLPFLPKNALVLRSGSAIAISQ